MAVDKGLSPAAVAQNLIASAVTGALATRDGPDGLAYPSLVLVATRADLSPILVLSDLARHTQNLARDPRSALLIQPSEPAGDPMRAARVTLSGRVARLTGADAEAARERFVLRYPDAEGYVQFADFGVYAFAAQSAHLIAGFGRIVDLGASALGRSVADFAGRQAALAAAVDAVLPSGDWRCAGVDGGGVDLVHGRGQAGEPWLFGRRYPFPARAASADEVGALLARSDVRAGLAALIANTGGEPGIA
jgi:hypothetical protein